MDRRRQVTEEQWGDAPAWAEAFEPYAYERRASGPALAAAVAAGVGSFVLGVLTTLAEALAPVKEWLTFRGPVGPLSGKTTLAVGAWAVSWLVLGVAWRRKEVPARAAAVATAVLVLLGLVGTFPAFFERFAAG